MSGPNFANIRTFSRSGNKAGQSVDQVLKEAERDPEYSAHVEQPTAPELIFGMTVDEVRLAHTALLASRKTKVQVKGEVKERAIRKDRHSLAGCVMSYPVPREQVEADREEWQRYLDWRDLNLRWLTKIWGDDLKSVVQHADEPYLHLHALGLPESDPGCDARTMNPAYMAKRRVLAAEKAAGKSNIEALKIANRAYRAEGRKLQDSYHTDVGVPSGLTRFGPRRRRLTRAEWHAEKERARVGSDHSLRANIREVVQRRDALSADVDDLIVRKSGLNAELDQMKADGRRILDSAKDMAQKITAAAESEKQAASREAQKLATDRAELNAETSRAKMEITLHEESLIKRRQQVEVVSHNVTYAAENLTKAIGTALMQCNSDKMTAEKMGKDQFEALQKISGKNEPTRLDWFRAWSLYDPEMGRPHAMPEDVVAALEGAFQKIADFDTQIAGVREQARSEGLDEAQDAAQKIVASARVIAANTEESATDKAKALLNAAAAKSHSIIGSAEKQASMMTAEAGLILDQAAQKKAQADEALTAAETEATRLVQEEARNRRQEPQARAWAAFATLLKQGVKAVFGEAGYQRLSDWITPRWAVHPDNPQRPVERRTDRTASRGPAP